MMSSPSTINMVNNPELNDILVQSGLADFTRDIKLGKFERSYDVARRTVVIISNIVKKNNWNTARDLINILKGVCSYIDGLGLVETAAGNMTRRIMRIIRDECHNFNVAQQRANQEEAFDTNRDETDDLNLNSPMNQATGIKENILEGIEQELVNELELSSRSIARQATDYVQSDEIILTLGKSKVIESFLRNAANGNGKSGQRKFTVIVVELAPFYSGREMAKALNKSGISTLIIPDSAVFAIMSRVNKVIMSTHSMMANGGIKAPASSHSIALAAKHFSVPLIVCCPMYKLTPSYLVSHDSVAFKQFSHLHAAFPEPYTPRQRSGPSEDEPTGVDSKLSEQEEYRHRPRRDSLDADKESLKVLNPSDIDKKQQQAKVSRPQHTGRKLDDKTDEPLNQLPLSPTVEAIHSTFDYVPPELITLFVSNIGGNSPSYVYQLLNELYYKSDYIN